MFSWTYIFCLILIITVRVRGSFTSRVACPNPNECRSKWGFCGTGPEYCGDGCQAGPCTTSGLTCPDPKECRSKWGFCGIGSEYCGDGCQAGPCTGTSTTGGTTFQGKATYYSVGVGYTACGTRHTDNEYIAALNAAQFDPHTPNGNPNKNTLCNKMAHVTGPKGTITVKIVDKCPGCRYGDLDLSKAAFQAAVGSLSLGIGQISWKWL